MNVIYGPGIIPRNTRGERVARLERALLALPQVNCPIRHYFAPGIYAREMSIPAGTVVTGAVHKTENLIVVSKGRLRIVTDDGTRDVAAGETFTCKPVMKNAVVALEDSRWTNFFSNPTNERDTDKLVDMLSESKACELMGGTSNRQLIENMKDQESLRGDVCL